MFCLVYDGVVGLYYVAFVVVVVVLLVVLLVVVCIREFDLVLVLVAVW